jgi:hypothetical protein
VKKPSAVSRAFGLVIWAGHPQRLIRVLTDGHPNDRRHRDVALFPGQRQALAAERPLEPLLTRRQRHRESSPFPIRVGESSCPSQSGRRIVPGQNPHGRTAARSPSLPLGSRSARAMAA